MDQGCNGCTEPLNLEPSHFPNLMQPALLASLHNTKFAAELQEHAGLPASSSQPQLGHRFIALPQLKNQMGLRMAWAPLQMGAPNHLAAQPPGVQTRVSDAAVQSNQKGNNLRMNGVIALGEEEQGGPSIDIGCGGGEGGPNVRGLQEPTALDVQRSVYPQVTSYMGHLHPSGPFDNLEVIELDSD